MPDYKYVMACSSRVEAQQMAKIYSLLKQSDSNMTIDDIRGQMSMYKTSYGDVGRDDDDDKIEVID